MMRCWCHAVMFGWLGGVADDSQPASPAVVARWRAECERAGADCGNRVEAMALRLPRVKALRDGATLRVFTQAGAIEFIDDARSGIFRYLGWHEACIAHLLLKQVGDSMRFMLLSNSSAQMTELNDCRGPASASLPAAAATAAAASVFFSHLKGPP